MASKKPAMYTRKWYLNNLLKSVFGLVKVNYTEPPEDVQILERSGLADKFTYDSVEVMARSQSKMNKLFYLTFIDPNVSFEIRTKRSAFVRETAVENAKTFFSEYGVSDTALLDAETVYIGLKQYILPAVFETNSYSTPIDFPFENIQKRFQQSMNSFSSYLTKKRFFACDDINQEECYYDSAFFDESFYKIGSCISTHLGKCNFAIPITFREVFHPPVFQLVSVLIPFSPRQEKVVSKEERFKELVSGYIPISPEQHLLLKDHSWYRNMPEMGDPFTQSYTFPTSFPEPHDLDKNVYFLTRLDQSTVESLYENPQTHAELHQAILKRAQKYMRQQNETLRHIEAEWCLNAMTVIENTLERVSRLAGYREYLLGADPDNQRGNEILSVFDIPENVLDFMHDYTDNDEKWGVIFTAFDWAVNAFFSSISKVIDAFSLLDKNMGEDTQKRNDKPSEIANYIRLNTTESERTRHIEYIEDILMNEAFSQAIMTQRETPPATVPILQTERCPFTIFNSRIPHLFEAISANIAHYLDQLR